MVGNLAEMRKWLMKKMMDKTTLWESERKEVVAEMAGAWVDFVTKVRDDLVGAVKDSAEAVVGAKAERTIDR